LLVLAAEYSGDELGARLIEGLLKSRPNEKIYAIGGSNMARVAPHFLFDLAEHAAMGLWEVLRRGRFFYEYYREILRWIGEHRPRRICFIDSPSLHLRIAHALNVRKISRKGGGTVSLYYYVAPQVWAWKAKRRFAMAKDLDALAVLFPFESKVFADTTLPVTFTGHPFLDPDHKSPVRYEKNRTIFLLPGSRRQNIQHIFPTMLEAFDKIQKTDGWFAICLYPSESIRLLLEAEVRKFPKISEKIRLISTEEARKKPVGGQLVLVSSGTMSFQCALEGIPGVVIYKTSPLTYWIGRQLVKIPFLALANIILGYECYRESIQDRANADVIARQSLMLISARAEFKAVSDELWKCFRAKECDAIKWLST
jgi:lipid-A-disaccharide synthase